jgi:hypothetical protein
VPRPQTFRIRERVRFWGPYHGCHWVLPGHRRGPQVVRAGAGGLDAVFKISLTGLTTTPMATIVRKSELAQIQCVPINLRESVGCEAQRRVTGNAVAVDAGLWLARGPTTHGYETTREAARAAFAKAGGGITHARQVVIPALAGRAPNAIRSTEAARVHHATWRRGGGVAAGCAGATARTRRFDTTEHNLRSISRPLAARLTRLLRARSGIASSATAKVFPIPAFSFQGSDSVPAMILAKQRPKFPTALREPLAKPLLKQGR